MTPRTIARLLTGLPIAALVLSTIALAPAPASAQAACQIPAEAKPLAACIKTNRNAVIGTDAGANCTTVVVDNSYTGGTALAKIKVQKGGTLYFPDKTLNIEAQTLEIDEGLVQAGTAACPIGTANVANKLTITFTGDRPCAQPGNCTADFYKGIRVGAKGMLRMYGGKGTPVLPPRLGQQGVSWTHLREAAGPESLYGPNKGVGRPVPTGGGTTLQLADDVSRGPAAWQKGDWIAVATTSYSPFETEFVQIDTVTSKLGGAEVKLVQPLKHYHFGGPDPGPPSSKNFDAPASQNFGVDERAEVGLISRSIKLTAKISGTPGSEHWGGEILLQPGFSQAFIQGVQLEKFGKDQLGSYPIHFHHAGALTKVASLINANSIHHSYNKCVTLHSTSNVTISNNVCARIVGHIFYQEIGDENGIAFTNNVGMGAMSNLFDIRDSGDSTRADLIKKYFWAGDNLGQIESPTYNGYDGFKIPNTDKQDNPTHGKCFDASANGELTLPVLDADQNPPCKPGRYYTEPASGFWIVNPATVLTDNSIAGCQGVGRGYWYVPPAEGPADLQQLKFKELGEFSNNRVHGCYAGLYAEPEFGVRSEQIQPRKGGVPGGMPIIAKFDGITATRNRFRSVWLRPFWYHVTNARLASSRENVTLVSSGGLDGNAPGVWALFDQSVVVGLSTNNVDRFGPCPYEPGFTAPPDTRFGGAIGCIDRTPFAAAPYTSGDQTGDGYPSPRRNFFGYMIYDGPVRIFNNRFVNFNQPKSTSKEQPGLTTADQTFLKEYSAKKTIPNTPSTNTPFVYEGDAALGWFQANQSGYPTSTVSRGLTWTNVDLRHQIYTDLVNVDKFQDGDKNTAIIDLDGTLADYAVVDASCVPNPSTCAVRHDAHPISLNNLPFNGSSNSVDECLSEGRQNITLEGRPTSLMSPGSMATLEFEALWPNPPMPPPNENVGKHHQTITFRRDNQDFGQHPPMALKGRDGRGVWEPKVTSGHGYTVGGDSGIPRRINIGLVDGVKPQVSATNPFYVRMGVCYTSSTGNTLTADDFEITKGYKSWGGAGMPVFLHPDLNLMWTRLENVYKSQVCIDLDDSNRRNLDAVTGCPAAGVLFPGDRVTTCPAGSTLVDGVYPFGPGCVFDRTKLVKTGSIDGLINHATGLPYLDRYFYDADKRMLFFYVQQTSANAFGPSPLGSCTASEGDDPACPDLKDGESYYPCPAEGCSSYVVRVKDAVAYEPVASSCDPYPKYKQDDPDDLFVLWDLNAKAVVERSSPVIGKDGIGHYKPIKEPKCSVN